MFNPYMMYSYSAKEMQTACDDKILVDLSLLEKLDKYSEVDEFVNRVFGQVDKFKIFDYPNEIKVQVIRKENYVEVNAIQKNKEIFGHGWRLLVDEVEE